MKKTIFTVCLLTLLWGMVPQAQASGYDIANVSVSIQADDAVKARDTAITKAQRVAFAQLIGKTEADITSVKDAQIARLVRDFSVRGERLASKSYTAFFSIRFDPTATEAFVAQHHWTIVPQAATTDPVTGAAVANTAATPAAAPVLQNIVILPVLDIGTRRTIWDDPNPWRDVWQNQSDLSKPLLNVQIPLGDASDAIDIPDAAFLKGGHADTAHLLTRYNAKSLYIVVAQNQGAALDPSGGMSLSVYQDDGQKLKFIRKAIVHPRLGYAFEDAVPVAMQIVTQHALGHAAKTDAGSAGMLPPAIETTPLDAMDDPSQAANGQHKGGPLNVTIIYQSLSQFVSLQQRLRQVSGVVGITPIRVSSSSAQVHIETSLAADQLQQNLIQQGFTLETLADGEMTLVEQR